MLRAYVEWGLDCVHRFDGIFAFAIWDGRHRRLWLVRDPFGVEPLFYALVNRRLSFASEISALWQNPDVSRDVDIEGFDAFMTFISTCPASERKYSFSQVLNRFVYGANQGKWRDHAS